ncbi:multidrug MFS transporter [Paenibacillus ihbetae]|uniref:Multidrug MFS transporter n=1 Tax=Paenibacillus ihbetae TaxID=1870820 RepID=A0A1B2E7S9_9BACL|nr:YdcF family protein [Paenibacillus ihbetae]ANY75977.1 multidrug MFS transporter [Paenibacillus ihbetae]
MQNVSRSYKNKGSRTRTIRRIVLSAAAVIMAYVVYAGVVIWTFGAKAEPVKSDAAIVLGAAVWDGKPSPVFQGRIDHALWLYEHQYVDKLIFTGGRGSALESAESEVARDYALARGVPEADIMIETASKITEENLSYAQAAGEREGLSTYLIVSDPLHMKRAMTMAEDYGMIAYPSPTDRSAYRTLRSKIPFLLREMFYYTGYVVLSPFR